MKRLQRLDPRRLEVARRGTPRAINRQVVLNLLRAHQPISRAELARRLGMQRAALGRIVGDLIQEGLVREGAAGQTERGRKPTLLHLDSRDRCCVAVDVRVTRTFLVLTDLVGKELSAVRSFVTARTPPEFIAALEREIRSLLAEHPAAGRCHGVGVAFPGMLDRTASVVAQAPALGWRDVELLTPLQAAIGLPVVMENAAKACALAHIWSGDAPPGDFVFVSVSDGVGVGIVLGGEVLRGRHNVAGEFGHLPLSIDGPRCACGATGCWEAYVSNLATLARYTGQPLRPGEALPAEFADLTVDQVVACARKGDVRAVTALSTTGHYLGLGLASIVNTFDPERVIIGGEITGAWDIIQASLRRGLAERALHATGEVEIVIVSADDHPRLRGASALVGAQVFVARDVA
jgi:predicted NBD/HSP70 family sugar kinase